MNAVETSPDKTVTITPRKDTSSSMAKETQKEHKELKVSAKFLALAEILSLTLHCASYRLPAQIRQSKFP